MKNSKFVVMRSLLSIVCISFTIHAHEDLLKPLHDKIRKDFIDTCSSTVAHRVKKGKPLSKDFQKFLEENEVVQKILQVRGDGTGKFSVEVVNKKDEIIKDCKHKRDELNAENIMRVHYEDLSMAGCGVGAALTTLGGWMAFILAPTADKSNQTASRWGGAIVGLGGITTFACCWLAWSRNIRIQEEKQLHVTEITKIEEKWERSFVEMQKKHDHKHGHYPN